MRSAAFIAAFACAALSANAEGSEDPAPQSPPPPCSADVFRQFDFWVGEWEVFTTDEQKAGDNVITVEENGCLLVERWTSAQGGTGQSYNYVDLATNKWRQVWVSAGGTIDYSGGLDENGAMALKGEIAYPGGTTAPFQGVWTLQDDGSVRQHFLQYNAETEEWDDWFIGIYKPKSAKAE